MFRVLLADSPTTWAISSSDVTWNEAYSIYLSLLEEGHQAAELQIVPAPPPPPEPESEPEVVPEPESTPEPGSEPAPESEPAPDESESTPAESNPELPR